MKPRASYESSNKLMKLVLLKYAVKMVLVTKILLKLAYR
jgi:hypothetical protein